MRGEARQISCGQLLERANDTGIARGAYCIGGTGPPDAATCLALGAHQRLIGSSKNGFGPVSVHRRHRNAQGSAKAHLPPIMRNRGAHRVADAPPDGERRLLIAEAAQEDHELIAPDAADQVAATNIRPDALRGDA